MHFYSAPAKLNLMLHVVGQRADGYHLLQTVFQFLDYSDRIGIKLRNDGLIRRVSDLENVPEADDLVVKAARLFADSYESFPGVDLFVEKSIPMGGGLGGGSSDAASTLMGLNMLLGEKFTINELAQLGVRLGADVPVFIHGQACWAEGVGEKITPLDLPEPWFLVINPGVHVSTAEIFSHSDLTRSSPLTTIADFFSQGGRNDCEDLVRKLYPEVDDALILLSRFAKAGVARMTGTGASLFVPFDNEQEALSVLAKLPQGYEGFVAKGMNRSPLLDDLI